MNFELIILGSSSALPTSRRNTAAHLLNVNERFFLIDCGEGTQVRMRQMHLSPAKINHIFISHTHGDHLFGLFGLISSLGMMGRKAPLFLYGPSRLELLLQNHLEYFGPQKFDLIFHEAKNDKILYQDSKIEVIAIKLRHRIETFGYLFREKPHELNLIKSKIPEFKLGIEDIKNIKSGADHISSSGERIPNTDLTLPPIKQRSYAYISDTLFLPEITHNLKGVDLLFHESTFLEKDLNLARETFHSTARQAAEIAKRSAAGKLLLGHFSTRYKNNELFEVEARDVFVNSYVVNDGDRFEVPMTRQVV